MPNDSQPLIQPFASAMDWEAWLAQNHGSGKEIWIQIAKKGSGIPSVTYDEAIDVALCYGWIDGQRRTHDADFFIQRFTPRRAKSLWSKRNVAKVAQLIDAARMQAAGLVEVGAAQRDGRWDAAYDGQRDMVVPDDFLQALQANAQAQAFFEGLGKSDRFTVGLRLQTAKTPETRQRRIEALIDQLERHESLGAVRKQTGSS